jgi:hypothetical protein
MAEKKQTPVALARAFLNSFRRIPHSFGPRGTIRSFRNNKTAFTKHNRKLSPIKRDEGKQNKKKNSRASLR